MFFKLLAISLVLVTCNAQEHLTCLRTDDVINSSPPPPPASIQGRPGRRGPPGEKGESIVGMKGEPGTPDKSLIDSLRDTITRDLQRGYMELDDGWIAPFNGYQYKATPERQTWSESRTLCQSWGGELIVHGFRDHVVRVTIRYALGLDWYWIGLTDEASEGDWRWLNGHRASASDVTLWKPGEPDNFNRNSHYARSIFSTSHADGFLAYDDPSYHRFKTICEKRI